MMKGKERGQYVRKEEERIFAHVQGEWLTSAYKIYMCICVRVRSSAKIQIFRAAQQIYSWVATILGVMIDRVVIESAL